jgi:hypothetical protein
MLRSTSVAQPETIADLFDLANDPPPKSNNAAPSAKGHGVECFEVENFNSAYSKQDDALLAPVTLEGLASARQWVAWRPEDRNGKSTKIPYDPNTRGRYKARSNDRGTWANRRTAEDAARRIGGAVGLMLGQLVTDPALHLAGLDLDSCRDAETGEIATWASEIIAQFASYAEVSPSGTGVKVFFVIQDPDLSELRAIVPGEWGRTFSRGNHCEIALWFGNRYFAVTGDGVSNTSPTLSSVSFSKLKWLIEVAGPRFMEVIGAKAPTLLNTDDNSRSAAAFRLATEVKRSGGGWEAFMSAIRAQPDLFHWAKETPDGRNANRAWERSPGANLSDLDDLEDLTASRLSFLSPDDCDNAPSRGCLIKGLIAAGDVGCIFGAPGAGKSLIAPWLGYAVAQGREAFGMRTKQGGVFYVAAEDPHGMRGRVKALKAEYGAAPDFTLVEGVSDLLTSDSPDLKALKEAVEARRPALIFLDTLAMSFPGLEENSAEAMGRVVKVARDLTAWGAAVVLIHHDTKAEGSTPRGHSILNGALDMALHVQPRDESGVIRGKLTKNRNGTCDRDIAFSIGTIDMGVDEDGDTITIAICRPLSGQQAARGPKLSASAKAALSVLRDLERENLSLGQQIVSESAWRDACIAGRAVSGAEKRDDRRRAFDRALRTLAQCGVVRVSDAGVISDNPYDYNDLDGDGFDE